MPKRLFLLSYDIVFVTVTVFIVSALYAQCAYAYVDPSVMTYTIQALAGVAVALSAIAGVAFRRVRKKIIKSLNIDENANKIVEPAIHRINPETGEVMGDYEVPVRVQSSRRSIVKQKNHPNTSRLPWVKRLALAALVSVFLVFTSYVVPSLEMFGANSASLNIGLNDIAGLVIVSAVVIALLLTLLISLIPGRVFDIALCLLFVVGLCAYVQAMFLNGGLPPADGSVPDWIEFRSSAFMSLIVWFVLGLLFIVISVKKIKIARGATVALCAALIIVQGAGVASLWLSPQAPHDKRPVYTTKEGLFTVSSKSNVVVFVLDTLDTEFIESALVKYPAMLDNLDGFTWYKNNAGGMIPTRYGVPLLLTGNLPKEGQSCEDYKTERVIESTFIPDIATAGYSIGLYSDTLDGIDSEFGKETINLKENEKIDFDFAPVLKIMIKCSLYRDVPWSWKQYFHYNTDDINQATAVSLNGSDDGTALYAMDDTAYYHELQNRKLRATDKGPNGAFRFIHLMGCHIPYNMTAEGETVDVATTVEDEVAGSFTIVNEYLNQLKEMDLLDDTTVIITADHGRWYLNPKGVVPEEGVSNAALFVKLPNNDIQESAALTVSDAPTCPTDTLPTVLASMHTNYSKYGQPVYDIPLSKRERYFYWTTSDGRNDTALVEYSIESDPFDINSWVPTGRTWITEDGKNATSLSE